MTPILAIDRLYKAFAHTPVLTDVNLEVHEGEIVCILGPSGCGKTTLLRLICGFDTPDAGQIFQAGALTSMAQRRIPPEKRQIGMVFQDYAVFPHLNVWNNLKFGLQVPWWQRLLSRISGQPMRRTYMDKTAQEERIAEVLQLAGLKGMEKRFPHELSGGQLQRVALARALATNPQLVLLDEPFSNLDVALRQRIREEVRDLLKKAGTTSILVTHDQEEALSMADRVVVMNEGKVVQVGPPEDIVNRPVNRFVAGFVGLSDFLPGTVAHDPAKGLFVSTELGDLPLEEAHPPEVGSSVEVLLRPDALHPCNGHDAPGTGVEVGVEAVDFMGIQRLYTLRTQSGFPFRALLSGCPPLHTGDKARVLLRPAATVVFSKTPTE